MDVQTQAQEFAVISEAAAAAQVRQVINRSPNGIVSEETANMTCLCIQRQEEAATSSLRDQFYALKSAHQRLCGILV